MHRADGRRRGPNCINRLSLNRHPSAHRVRPAGYANNPTADARHRLQVLRIKPNCGSEVLKVLEQPNGVADVENRMRCLGKLLAVKGMTSSGIRVTRALPYLAKVQRKIYAVPQRRPEQMENGRQQPPRFRLLASATFLNSALGKAPLRLGATGNSCLEGRGITCQTDRLTKRKCP